MACLYRQSWSKTDPKTGRERRGDSRKWYGKWTDENGHEQREPLSEDRAMAEDMLRDRTRRVEQARAGILPASKLPPVRPLTVHLDDWRLALLAKGNTEAYAALKYQRAADLILATGARLITDLSGSAVERQLERWRKDGRTSNRPGKRGKAKEVIGARTSNHYLAAVKQFCRWMIQDRRAADNPVAYLAGSNADLDVKHARRDLADADLVKLLAAARAGRVVRKLTGPDREMLYLVALYTGLRAAELGSLTPESFDLAGSPPTVTVEAGYSKHRRRDVLPLHPDAVTRLRPWLQGRAGLLWGGQWAKNRIAHQLIKHDLKAVGLPYRAGGRVFDFHALRHTFITRLVKSGVKPKEAQTLARHSTITLTMDHYTHLDIHDVTAAVGMPPALTPALTPAREAS